ncbi:CASP-like protein 4B1 [Salvia miltiorrhiza]|uniref:CASP-like protein 4B1 n=1 Tax=Salvia miltiorrhiza TaxID=226208 RepID=UPI0025ABEE70|nr:CASP-like protein 4B1 [Salvia miltiorrhiza]
MTKPTDAKPEEAPPPAADVENQRAAAAGGGVSNILQRWRREGILKRGSLAFRAFGLLFSLLAFIIMATNQHGDGREFDKYEEYRYVLAIAILSALYTGLQTWKQIHEIYTTREIISRQNASLIDFIGDQLVAYLLLSAASAAVPLTNSMRQGSDNIFTDSSASAISMEFFAFFSLGLSALISGYKLSSQTYI